MQKRSNVYVTQPLMPPLEEFIPYLEQIWESRWLTNGGPFHQELEVALADYLGVEHLALFANGTIALVTALQTLRITGEVITTPYSFVATAHSLLWNGITPVFVDIEPGSCNLDPDKIEEAITPRTTAIMPVHCYGTPCDVDRIQAIADTYGLKVIYDAAHAFGVKYRGESLSTHGDLCMLSFHATKVFNTFEGGALVCPDAKTKQRVDFLKNFGHAGEVTVVAPGINGKMNEMQAAFGLLQLRHFEEAIARRSAIDALYRSELESVPGVHLLPQSTDTVDNHAYFPIFLDSDYPLSRDALNEALRTRGIYPRRYFYPLIAEFPMYRGLPSADLDGLTSAVQASRSVLCLPIYPALELSTVEEICRLVAAPDRVLAPFGEPSGLIVKAAIMQPYFFPYIGYFQLISAVDLFVLYDDIKYTKKGWINRNRILSNGRDVVFSLPLKHASDYLDVRDREVAADFSPDKMLNRIEGAYRRAPHFSSVLPLLEKVLRHPQRNLFDFLSHSIASVCSCLGIETAMQRSSDVPAVRALKGQARVLATCEAVGAHTYINPIGGTGLYSRDEFRRAGVELKFVRSLPFEYAQFDKSFVPDLSIIDVLMFNEMDVVRDRVKTAYELT